MSGTHDVTQGEPPQPTYDPSACCGDDCYAIHTTGQPCWGPVEVVDEVEVGDEWYWVHACTGHRDAYDGSGPYVPPPPDPTAQIGYRTHGST